MIGERIDFDKQGSPTNATVSSYKPSNEVQHLTAKIKEDYDIGHRILHNGYEEFNGRSILQEVDLNQKLFNSYIAPSSVDPLESWKAHTIRPLTRNKVISIAAHVVSSVIYPNVFAQNEDDKEDREAAQVMRDLIEWTIRNSDYENTFLFAIITALVNPAVVLKDEFTEVMQTIKVKKSNGQMSDKEVIDEVLSGFQTHIVPVDELWISNVYEHELQRQRFVGRKRYVEYDVADALWGKHKNFKHVQPGIRTVFNGEDSTFYDQKDEQLDTLVEEFTYYNRREDLEVVFINGILVTDMDQRIRHRDNQDHPKYPFAKSGYEPVDERRFFYYKSVVSKLSKDQELIDTMWNMVMDGTFLSLMPPMNVFGDEDRGASVVVPGASNYYAHESRVEPMNIGTNLNAGYNALQAIEQSMAESSQDASRQGVSTTGERTAKEVAIMEQNAKIQLGLFGQMVSQLVRDYGDLRIDNILNHMTVASVNQITAGQTRMAFNTFLLPDQVSNGKTVTKRIRFTEDRLGEDTTTEGELEKRGFARLKEEGGMDSEERIIDVKPDKFRKLKFNVFVDADTLNPKNEEFEKAMKLEAYDRMIQNPLVDQQAVTKDFLVDVFADGGGDKYMKKASEVAAEQQPQAGGQEGNTSSMVERQVNTPSLSELIQQ